MSITYDKQRNIFTIRTKNTCYAMQMLYGEYPVHLYYGRNVRRIEPEYRKYESFAPYVEKYGYDYSPDIHMSEFSFFGVGDMRATALRVRNHDGNSTTLYKYRSYKIFDGRAKISGLPYAEADENTKTLALTLWDDVTDCELILYYTVFADCDVISRSFKLINHGKYSVKIEKAMSLALDLPTADYDMITLSGQYFHERHYRRNPLFYGNQSIRSRRGTSSHHFNPFIALASKRANEEHGDVYGFNFVFSGCFLDEVEVDQNNTTRVQIGLGDENFGWLLSPGASFESPEAIMTYTHDGIGQMSRNMHRFAKHHIVPKEQFEVRPTVLNSWEASYFDIDEDKLVEFARQCPKAGIDMLVMDDGWFSTRDDDDSGLGDWWESRKKFPDGLGHFVRRVKDCGIKFGIWIEPEMVNPDSELYRAHPEWILTCPGREPKLGRRQYILDMSNPDVISYLKYSFAKTFDGLPIDYFKWDMNRNMAEVGSFALPADRQDEVYFRYVKGVYDLLSWFREHFPNAMIEGCSGGGGRYDLGMMKYEPMIWTSDNTWPLDRIPIQFGSTIAYPASEMSCHVTNPRNVCTDPREMNFRFRVALNGMLGYELHLPNASDEIKAEIKAQIAEYRRYESVIKDGELYRIHNPMETPYYSFYFTNEARSQIVLTFIVPKAETKPATLKISAADRNAVYKETKSGKTYSGAELAEGIILTPDGKEKYAVTLEFLKQ